ncbi:hypothetical protein Y032_0954g3195 [Ancylostoma ceylanicum]|uniref:Uncharacterized protein n=1 Tax=Ancylostoma ceylanicum TaxID=53326 RepID=A0A016W9J6_9BILA|nr:hypothetical protein Y032_0954g3195 [Ancylostoma ceylanicum]
MVRETSTYSKEMLSSFLANAGTYDGATSVELLAPLLAIQNDRILVQENFHRERGEMQQHNKERRHTP